MAGSVSISPTSVPVVPGEQGTATVRIRNTGVVVDQFAVSVLGQPAVWTTAVPAVLSLFPGAEGTIELHFAPPRTAEVGAGSVPFGVRVDASQDPDSSVVEEGEVSLLPFVDVQAKLTPRTSEAKKRARHEVLVDNRGNSDIEAEIDAGDPDELLIFDVKPRTVTVPAGQSIPVPVKVAARKGFLKGTDKQRPFQVRVTVGRGYPPITLDGTLMQKAGMPRFVMPLVGVAVALAVVALVLPAMKKDPQSGKLSLTSDQTATTTTVAAPEEAPAAEEPVDPNAPATPEEAAAAAAAELAANGKDTTVTTVAASGGDTTTAAGTSESTAEPTGTAKSGDSVVNGSESTEVTSPPATAAPPPTSPSTTTTVANTTTTTVPSKEGTVRGTWTYDLKAGLEGSGTADFWWQIGDSTTRWLTPTSGAQVSNMGVVDYEAVTQQRLQSLTYSTGKITGSDSGNQMPVGTVIAFKTTNGRFAKFKVLAKEPHPSNKLTFRYFVY